MLPSVPIASSAGINDDNSLKHWTYLMRVIPLELDNDCNWMLIGNRKTSLPLTNQIIDRRIPATAKL
ncbi:MAG: hypothetical protein ACKVHR_08835 [Pirellulales bacterium]